MHLKIFSYAYMMFTPLSLWNYIKQIFKAPKMMLPEAHYFLSWFSVWSVQVFQYLPINRYRQYIDMKNVSPRLQWLVEIFERLLVRWVSCPNAQCKLTLVTRGLSSRTRTIKAPGRYELHERPCTNRVHTTVSTNRRIPRRRVIEQKLPLYIARSSNARWRTGSSYGVDTT